MINLISQAIAPIVTLLRNFQVKQFLAVVFVGFILLTSGVSSPSQSERTLDQIQKSAHQIDSQRPKTTGEWNKEAQEDVSLPQRVKDIAEDSVEAFKDWGKLYPNVADRSADNANLKTATSAKSYADR